MIPLYVPDDWVPDIKKLAEDNGAESIVDWVRSLIRDAATKEMLKRWSEPAKRGNPAFRKQQKKKRD